ncbi:MAG: hypothetical protein ACXU86_00615 [Archangium sp.]
MLSPRRASGLCWLLYRHDAEDSLMPTRYSPDSLGYFVLPTNENEKTHGRKRIVISFAVLALLDHLSAFKKIDSQARVTAEGSTIQAKTGGGVGNLGQQWAHQVLRELSLNRVPLHLLEGLEEEWMVSFLYCNSAVSKIGSIYNEADGLIESRIREGFVALATKVLREAPLVPFRSILAQGQLQRRGIWVEFLELFIGACQKASEDADKQELKNILDRYVAEATTFKQEAFLIKPAKSQEYYRYQPAQWNTLFAKQIGSKPHITDSQRGKLRKKLWQMVQTDRAAEEKALLDKHVKGLLALPNDLFD